MRAKYLLADAHYNLARSYMKLYRLGDAIQSYEAALELNPFDDSAVFNLANCLMKLQERTKAIHLYEQSIRLGAKNGKKAEQLWNSFRSLANALKLDGQVQKAKQIFEDHLVPHCRQYKVWNDYGSLLAVLKQFTAARDAFQVSLAIQTSQTALHNLEVLEVHLRT